jgi:hypothetical protein
LASGIGMIVVACAAAWYWKRASGEYARLLARGTGRASHRHPRPRSLARPGAQGIQHVKPWMIGLSFLIFTLVDSLAGAFLLSGAVGSISSWWMELTFSVAEIASIASLVWLVGHFGAAKDDTSPLSVDAN